ncbi:nitrous oxide-stimulated promoter family protein [Vibrio sp. SCSIO 43136]|uniref:nitrous oxide-stimulated promoter family protein n=1 Tax=Vibrio sp. SCSIO 43136 TaxID=2819101 RepID=UPI002074D9A0|nr:nitrous oxide-stimulated promoter family protein [Vibrio sp. SCSIO 43136]USD68068.1 nitrous oxide-stimulated promoter family protein [Vibrio sp. SCSIO 43136]
MTDEILKGALAIEFKTVDAMVSIYCRDHHGTVDGQCDQCKELLEYAHTKLDRCPYGESKPACNKCPIHCYKPEPKEQMRLVMRYSGPRMLLPHPILSIRHLIKERKAVPSKPAAHQSNRAKRKRAATSD